MEYKDLEEMDLTVLDSDELVELTKKYPDSNEICGEFNRRSLLSPKSKSDLTPTNLNEEEMALYNQFEKVRVSYRAIGPGSWFYNYMNKEAWLETVSTYRLISDSNLVKKTGKNIRRYSSKSTAKNKRYV